MESTNAKFPEFDLSGKVALVTGHVPLIDGGWTAH